MLWLRSSGCERGARSAGGGGERRSRAFRGVVNRVIEQIVGNREVVSDLARLCGPPLDGHRRSRPIVWPLTWFAPPTLRNLPRRSLVPGNAMSEKPSPLNSR